MYFRSSSVLVFSLLALSALFLAVGCSAGTRRPADRDGGPPPGDGSTSSMCSVGSTTPICRGTTEISCNSNGTEAGTRDCSTSGQVCAPGIGCAACVPNRGTCDGQTPGICRADGSGYDMGAACDASAGLSCNPSTGQCTSPCDDAVAQNSYIGCDYWAVTTSNSQVAEEFVPALVVTNPGTAPAQVTVTLGGSNVATVTVAPGALETISTPWIAALKGTLGEEASSLLRASAYHLTSSLPVTVYQFNPLEFRIPRDCANEPSGLFDPPPDNQCFSYSNDASLLLPTHVLTGNYTILSRQSLVMHRVQGAQQAWMKSPGFFTVVGVDATSELSITFSANVIASTDGSVRAFGPGETGTFSLGQGDVLQILAQTPETCPAGSPFDTRPGDILTPDTTDTYCDLGAAYDLTGTQIRSVGKIEVFAGHNCDFVPNNRWACDHLEEAMFPLETWGKDFIVSTTRPTDSPALRDKPNVIRIVSGADGNTLTFDPSSTASGRTLNQGEMMEFEASGDFRVTGSGPLMVGQFMVGQDYAGPGTGGAMGQGDPSMSLAIPTEQFRSSYTFLAPTTYDQSWVNVTATAGQTVTLDGSPITGFQAVGGTGMQTARVPVSGGSHTINSGDGFGIVVYGIGSFTSYMYPGGLDLNVINPLI
ncbi:MAG: hypothetical protein GXP55_11110 [Deltaproteobacteria bacterium]|nr:hypothetical protein [Deltaproteobacteria bacterium]